MPSLVATIRVKEDKVEEARAFLKELCAETLANEPGTLAYVAHQRKDDPTAFVFYEKYASDETLAAHRENLKSKAQRFGALLAGAPEVVLLEEL